jgi:uncharacterized protein YgiM (DUF1202 family)
MKFKARLVLFTLVLSFLAVPVLGVVASAAEQTRQLALPILIVNTGALNVRSGPGPQYTILTSVPGGVELPVLGTNENNSWYLVATVVGAGWVDVSFTIPRGDFSYVPLISMAAVGIPLAQPLPQSLGLPQNAGVVAVPQLETVQVIVNTGRLNVRSGPGPQYTILGSVPGGTTFAPLGVTADNMWYLVDGTFGRGWIYAEYTIFRGVFDNIPVILSAY